MAQAERAKAMELLRQAADILEKEEGTWIIPGWWPEDEALEALGGDEHAGRCAGIRTAARAFLAEGLNGDQCTKLPFKQMGFLARCIGDILME